MSNDDGVGSVAARPSNCQLIGEKVFTIDSPSVFDTIEMLERNDFDVSYSYTLFGDDPEIIVSFGCIICRYHFNDSAAEVYMAYDYATGVVSKSVMTPNNFLSLCKIIGEMQNEV